MSRKIEHFAKRFPKGKNHAVIKDIAEAISRTFGIDANQRFDAWSKGSSEALYRLSYKEASDPWPLIGMRLFNALFEKNRSVGGLTSIERREKTLAKWFEAEAKCRETNARFEFGASGHSPEFDTLIFLVSKKISSILGPCPKFSSFNFGFGPGANVGVSRLTSVRRKISAKPTLSANAVAYLTILQESHPHWSFVDYEVVKGRLTFVPKSAVIDRPIVVEPIINTYVQKGIGSYIRSQLRRAGVDLNSQETNRDFARLGSITGMVSTIDLSSASDTISKNVVAELLPWDWFKLLSDFRTPSITIKGEVITLQKFSSMGNGFTFELESLIFFAICSVICDGSKLVNAYGDDLIVPTSKYEETVAALEFFGFSVNLEKSFSSGQFRESCGKDFFAGVDLRPCYVKDSFSFKELFRYHNFCKRNGYDKLASAILRHLPRKLTRFVGPDGFGDGHLIGDWRPIRTKRKDGWSLLGFRTLATAPIVRSDVCAGDYAAFLFSEAYGRLDRNPLLYDSREEAASAEYLASCDMTTSDSMYIERGSTRYRISKVYTWAR